MTDCSYDLAVIGAGSAGFSAAITGANDGARVALIGFGTVGGTCVNVGCVPSKTLIRAAEAVHAVDTAGRFPGLVGSASVTDWAALMTAKDELVAKLRRDKYADLLQGYENIDYIEGQARLQDGALLVDGSPLRAARLVIATGAAPAVPDISGIDRVSFLTSTSALELAESPESLLVIGGGYIGCELAQLFARLGSRVTLATRSRLLPEVEPEVSDALTGYLREEGVAIWTGLTYRELQRSADGVALTIDVDGGAEQLHGRQVLVATGRKPNTEGFGLAEAGVALDERQRLAAWSLLRRLDPTNEYAGHLLLRTNPDERADDPILESLYAAANDLRAVPDTGEQLEWVANMRAPAHRVFWDKAKRAVGGLGLEQAEGLRLRHAAAVVWASEHEPSWLGLSRGQLLDLLASRLEGRKHYTRGVETGPTSGRLRDARDRMVWGDALLALIGADAIEEPDVIADLFAFAEEDREDTSTEYGGILDAAPGSERAFVVLLYPPRASQRFGDRQFVASDELLEAGAAALFHYHFHASDYGNRKYAGPSHGDIEYAALYGRAAIVFTFIDRDHLNADYYQPDGARIDLGTIRRP